MKNFKFYDVYKESSKVYVAHNRCSINCVCTHLSVAVASVNFVSAACFTLFSHFSPVSPLPSLGKPNIG